jgi:DNA-binding transcriptional MerR regulator
MTDYFTIAEISRLTGLASHTIRYYEKQFPVLLDVERSKGGHRIYRARHLEALKSVIRLLKDEKLSIRAARKMLGEPDSIASEKHEDNSGQKFSPDAYEINRSLMLVLEKLDRLCQSNERRDALLESILRRTDSKDGNQLIEQIARCRSETRETMKMYESLMLRWKNSN